MLYSSILNHLQNSSLSLADLLPLTTVSLPTLRKAVQDLSSKQWIKVVGQAEANGGRPAMLFGLDESYYMLLGVHIQLPGIHMIVTNLVGEVLGEYKIEHQANPVADEVVQLIEDYANDVQSQFLNRKLIGVGIAIPGFIEPDSGKIISIGRVSGWQDFPLQERLETKLGIPIKIANDIDCMAIKEFKNSKLSFENNLVYVGFDEGVKMSMFLNGKLYKGAYGNAGLINDQLLNVADSKLSLTDQHRIMTLSGINQIFEEKVAQLSEEERSVYDHILTKNYRERFSLILMNSDKLRICSEVTNMLRPILAVAIANIIYIIQPDVVILGGLLSTMPSTLLAEIRSDMRPHLPMLFSNRTMIERTNTYLPTCSAEGACVHFMNTQVYTHNFVLDMLQI